MNTLTREELSYVARAIIQGTIRQDSGCLLWVRDLSPTGYGRIWTGAQNTRAHRAAWILYHGDIPENLLVCHTCDVRACCEPSHLFLGTNDENMADMVSKSRQPLGKRNGLSKLTENDVIRIYTTDLSTRELAEQTGVSATTIRDIRRGELWAHVTSKLPYRPSRYASRPALRSPHNKCPLRATRAEVE